MDQKFSPQKENVTCDRVEYIFESVFLSSWTIPHKPCMPFFNFISTELGFVTLNGSVLDQKCQILVFVRSQWSRVIVSDV